MLYCIFSDVHGNLDKFNRMHKILNTIKEPVKLVSLGDITGGPYDHVRLIYDEVRFSGAYTAIKGNCDDGLDFVDGPIVVDGTFIACHGSPYRDNDYIRYSQDAQRVFSYLISENIKLLFYGHTHKQFLFDMDNRTKVIGGIGEISANQKVKLNKDKFYLCNPGTLGRPKPGSPFCGFALFDSANYTIQWVRV